MKCFRDGASSLDGCRLQDAGLQRPPLESLTSTLYIYATSLDSSRSQTPNLNLNLSLEAVYTSKTLNPNASCRSAAKPRNPTPQTQMQERQSGGPSILKLATLKPETELKPRITKGTLNPYGQKHAVTYPISPTCMPISGQLSPDPNALKLLGGRTPKRASCAAHLLLLLGHSKQCEH